MPVGGVLTKDNCESGMNVDVEWALRRVVFRVVREASRSLADFAESLPQDLLFAARKCPGEIKHLNVDEEPIAHSSDVSPRRCPNSSSVTQLPGV